MSDQRITVHGKQVKLDGRHLADCVDDESAAVIAICLNAGQLSSRVPVNAIERVERFFA